MTERTQLQPVEGLTRSTKIVSPPPKRAPRVVENAEPKQTATEPQQPSRPVAAKPQQPPTAPAKQAPSGDMKRMTLSLPVVVVEALRERASRDTAPHPHVLMDALEATTDRLGELLSEGDDTNRQSGLFVRTVPRSSETLTTLSLRVLASNLEVIDQLAESLGASSRSRMCAVALRDYLTLNKTT